MDGAAQQASLVQGNVASSVGNVGGKGAANDAAPAPLVDQALVQRDWPQSFGPSSLAHGGWKGNSWRGSKGAHRGNAPLGSFGSGFWQG